MEKKQIDDKIMNFIETDNIEVLNTLISENLKFNKLHIESILEKAGSFKINLVYEFRKKFLKQNSLLINEIIIEKLHDYVDIISQIKKNNKIMNL